MQGTAPEQALPLAVSDVGGSLVLCALTTGIGFYAFVPTAYTGISELGIIAGTGMFISLFTNLTVLPALLALFPLPHNPVAPARVLPSMLVRLSGIPGRHRHTVLVVTALFAVMALIVLPRIQFDYNPLHLRDLESESVATFNDLLASDNPPWHITLLTRDRLLAGQQAVQLRLLAEVGKVVMIDDLVPEDQGDKLAMIDELAIILGPEMNSGKTAPPPTGEQLEMALLVFPDILDAYLRSDNPPSAAGSVRRLRDRVRVLLNQLQGLDRKARHTHLQQLETRLLATLSGNLERLRASLDARPVGLRDLPLDLWQRWLSEAGVYRIAVYPEENINDDAAMRRFVSSVQQVAADATGAPVLNLKAGDAIVSAFRRPSCMR